MTTARNWSVISEIRNYDFLNGTTIWLENGTYNYKLVSINCFRKDSIVIFETKKNCKKTERLCKIYSVCKISRSTKFSEKCIVITIITICSLWIHTFCFWNPERTRFVTFSWPKKSGDKTGFGDESGCDKSENAQYLLHTSKNLSNGDFFTVLRYCFAALTVDKKRICHNIIYIINK